LCNDRHRTPAMYHVRRREASGRSRVCLRPGGRERHWPGRPGAATTKGGRGRNRGGEEGGPCQS
jgi:hypothetical protein